MARINPTVLNQIASIGDRPSPIAAFLVGRQEKLARERQTQIDELNQRNIDSTIARRDKLNEVADAQIAAATPADPNAEARALASRKAGIIPMMAELDLPDDQKAFFLAQVGNATSQGQIDDALQRAGVQLKDPVQETRALPPIDAKKLNTAAVDSANDSAALRRDVGFTNPLLAQSPDAVGIRGQVGQIAGGISGTLLGDAAGEAVTEAITGESRSDVAQIQARLQTIRSKLIPVVTGEESGRFSEGEREAANRVVSVIDSIKTPADLARDFPAVQGGLREIFIVSLQNEYEQALTSDAVRFPFDLNTSSGVDDLITEFENAGFDDEDTVVNAIKRLQVIQNARRSTVN